MIMVFFGFMVAFSKFQGSRYNYSNKITLEQVADLSLPTKGKIWFKMSTVIVIQVLYAQVSFLIEKYGNYGSKTSNPWVT